MFFKGLILLIIIQLIIDIGNADSRNETCTKSKDEGSAKCAKPTVDTRWHFDGLQGKCVNFTFNGCDGNKNNFKTEEDCQKQCCAAQKIENHCKVISISHDEIGCPTFNVTCEAVVKKTPEKASKGESKGSKAAAENKAATTKNSALEATATMTTTGKAAKAGKETKKPKS